MGPIIIRHCEPFDVEGVRAIYAEASTIAATLQLPHPSLGLWEKRINAAAADQVSLVALSSERVIGQISIMIEPTLRRRHVAAIGIGVLKSARRLGVGSLLLQESIALAERWMQILRIEADVYTDNVAAIGLFEKFGFSTEGTSTGFAFRDGQYTDVYRMARLKS